MYRYTMPPSLTPGDGRYGRQGTSLLYIAGEKTKNIGSLGIKNLPRKREIFLSAAPGKAQWL